MKNLMLIAVCLLLCLPVAAKKRNPKQADSPAVEQRDTVVWDNASVTLREMPKFRKGGLEEYRKWVYTRIEYPDEAFNEGYEGLVVVSIIVEPDGSVSIDKVVESPAPVLSTEVLRVIASSPKWVPGKAIDPETGLVRPVRVRYLLPVEFKFRPTMNDASVQSFKSQKNFKPYGS